MVNIEPHVPSRQKLAILAGDDRELLKALELVFQRVGEDLPSSINASTEELREHEAETDNPHDTSVVNLIDTTIISPGNQQSLVYDGDEDKWVNAEARHEFAEANPSGLANGGEVNIGPGVNDVEILAGVGIIIDSYTNPQVRPTRVLVDWPQINEVITAAPAIAGSIVYLTIFNTGVPSAPINSIPVFVGELVQRSVYPNPLEIRDELFLGIVLHDGTNWNDVSFPKVINNTAESLYDIMNTVIGPMFIIEGGSITEASLYTLDQASGVIWQLNRNWQNDHKNPHREIIPQVTGIQWRYTNRDFTDVGPLTSTVDDMQWDNDGTVEDIPAPGNNATIQRLYEDVDKNLWMLWGQTIYDNAQEAASRLNSPIVIPPLLNTSFLLGYPVVERGKNDWDADESFFVSGSASGGGSGDISINDHGALSGLADNDHPQYKSTVATRTILAEIDQSTAIVLLYEDGREGDFIFDSSDLSAQVTADTQQGLYVAPTTDVTGASGAWVRQFGGSANLLWFGAIGDNSTDNAAVFETVDDFQTSGVIGPTFIAVGTFFCDEQVYKPVGSYFGDGSLRFGGDGTFTDATIYPASNISSPIYTPLHDDESRGLNTIAGSGAGGVLDTDDTGTRFNSFFGHRAGGAAVFPRRSTVVGAWALREHTEPKFYDAFGGSALQFSRIGNRITALGSNAGKWLGTDDPVGDDHDFWHAGNLDVWVDKRFEDIWPDVRIDHLDGTIASTYSGSPRTPDNLTAFGNADVAILPITETDCENIVTLGRDSLIHGLKLTEVLGAGYKTLASLLEAHRVTSVGQRSGELGLWANDDTYVGTGAMQRAITTEDNVIVGSRATFTASSAARNVVVGHLGLGEAYDAVLNTTHQVTSKTDFKMINMVAIGDRVGGDLLEVTQSILIGAKAAKSLGSSENRAITSVLWVGNEDQNSGVPILSGSLNNGRLGVNVHHDMLDGTTDAAALQSQLTVVEGSITSIVPNANTSAKGLLIHREGAATGITISTDNNQNGNIFFADPDDNNVGRIQYSHIDDAMAFRAADIIVITLSAIGVNFANLPTSPSGLASGDAWLDSGVMTVV